MTFIDRLLVKAGANKMNRSLYSSYFSNSTSISPTRNYSEDLIRGYMSNETLYSIINKISRPASEVPLELVDGSGKVITSHWAHALISHPNEDTTINELIFNYYVYLLSIGNSFIYAPKLSNGRATELWTAPSDMVTIISGTWRYPIKGYEITYSSETDIIDKSDMLHSKLFNPSFTDGGHWMYGLSPIAVSAQILRQLNAGNERMALLAETGAPPFVISSSVPEGLTPVQQELLESTYDRKYGSIDKTNKPFLSGTPLRVDLLGGNASDLELIEASTHSLRVLCSMYGISSVLINDLSDASYNNINSLRKDLYSDVIIPLNSQFEKKLKQFLIPNEDLHFRFDYSNVEVLSIATDSRMSTIDSVGFLTVDEKRKQFGYEPIKMEKDESNL